MFRQTLTMFCAALAALAVGVQPVFSQEDDWIRPGAYIDWPESLHGNPADPVLPEPASQTLAASYLEETESGLPAGVLPVQPAGSNLIVVPSGWELLPSGLLYHSYLAGEKEPRMAAQWLWEKDRGLVWETALGGRWGLVRRGTPGPNGNGFQFDMEGAALARVDPEEESDLEAADFRAGFLGTWRRDRWRWKTGYYHLSSHVGDEFLIKNPGFPRRNYVRDSLLFGLMYDITPDVQIYGEIADALNHNGGAEPLELQFGAQYSPVCTNGIHGSPFAAINGHLRQEFDFSGSVNIEAGWQWRGANSGHLFRVGAQHYSGPSIQWSFYDRYESLTGVGIWFDY